MEKSKRIEIKSGLETVSLVVETGRTVKQTTEVEEKYDNTTSNYKQIVTHVVKVGYDEVRFAAKVAATKCYKRVVKLIDEMEQAEKAVEGDFWNRDKDYEEGREKRAVEDHALMKEVVSELIPLIKNYAKFASAMNSVSEELEGKDNS